MQKAKKYDWTDSNMALFGSDTEKKVKKDSALTEPAWKGAGEKLGLEIWRINKFKVEHWDKDRYGEFYNGDSYILLNTFKDPEGDEWKYDVHFWIGKYSTQDEYGTAAYKTVELDTLLDDKPVQHREVQGHETNMFKNYFDALTLLKGGAETGFKRVLPEQYKPRLLHVKKQANKKIVCTEVSLKRSNLTSDDVFIIDTGDVIYQYNGSKCSHDEKFKAAQECAKIKGARGKAKVETVEESGASSDHPAFAVLTDGQKKEKSNIKGKREMFKVSDEDGSLDMDAVEGYGKEQLTDDAVFIINTGDHVFCYVGKDASIDERKNGMAYASNYLNKTETPYLPITVVSQGQQNEDFRNAGF